MKNATEVPVVEEIKTFEIYDGYMEVLESKLKKMSNKAVKLGLAPVSLVVLEEFTRERKIKVGWDNYGGLSPEGAATYRTVIDHMKRVQIVGQKPIVKGYEFLAKLEHLEEGNLIRSFDGEPIPVRFRNASCKCDHCKVNRKRNVTYVIRNMEDQSYVQVGRTCLGDFFPYTNVENVAKYVEWISNMIGEMEAESRDYVSGGSYKPEYSLEEYLTIVAAIISKRGWMSRTTAREIEYAQATCDIAWSDLLPESRFNEHFLSPEDITEAHRNTALEAIEWAKVQVEVKMTDFNHNMSLVANRGSIVYDHIGFAAYIVAGYLKHKDSLNKESKAEKQVVNEHHGSVGDKIEVHLTVEKVVEIDGVFSNSHLHTMTDEWGKTFIWWCSNSNNCLEEGQTYKIKGTIKDHTEYKGVKQTVLTRCKVVEA